MEGQQPRAEYICSLRKSILAEYYKFLIKNNLLNLLTMFDMKTTFQSSSTELCRHDPNNILWAGPKTAVHQVKVFKMMYKLCCTKLFVQTLVNSCEHSANKVLIGFYLYFLY